MAGPFLCIGGFLAGKQYVINDDRTWFSALKYKPLSMALIESDHVAKSVDVDELIYERQTFYLEEAKPLHIWVPKGQSGTETMRLLCEAYIRENRRPTTPPEGGRG